jgi:hypothetical protein
VAALSRDENALSPTYLAMQRRKAWSDAHIFEDTGLYPTCGRCYQPSRHINHVTREQDKAEVMAWADRIRE